MLIRYWHRSLNPKKLIAVKFSHLSRHMTMQRTIRLYRLPMETKTEGLRLAQDKDMPRITQLLNDYLQKFDLCPVFHEVQCGNSRDHTYYDRCIDRRKLGTGFLPKKISSIVTLLRCTRNENSNFFYSLSGFRIRRPRL